MKTKAIAWGLAAAAVLAAAPSLAADVPIFFLHNSTGRNIIDDGGLRDDLAALGAARGENLNLWDHDYNTVGLSGPDGRLLPVSYGIPNDDTDPPGLFLLWTTANAARDSILSRYELIVFKSCFTAAEIKTDEQLQLFQDNYLAIRAELARHPDKQFVVMSIPPLHRLLTKTDQAARTRAFADWLGDPAFLAGHPNIHFFDIFDLLANPDDGSPTANMLRYEYERSHSTWDSHPNDAANDMLAPLLASFLADIATGSVPAEESSWGGLRSQYR